MFCLVIACVANLLNAKNFQKNYATMTCGVPHDLNVSYLINGTQQVHVKLQLSLCTTCRHDGVEV